MRTLLLGVALVASGAAYAAPPAQAYFAVSPQALSSQLSGMCMNAGFALTAADSAQVVCSKEVGGLRGAFAQLLIGNSYSTTPQQIVRFQIVPWNSGARVQVSEWVETQMAFGQVRRAPIDGSKATNSWLDVLYRAGGTGVPEFDGSAIAAAPPQPSMGMVGPQANTSTRKVRANTPSGYCLDVPSDYMGTGSASSPAVTKAMPRCSNLSAQ